MGIYVAQVWPRWSDMDAYNHVNNAKLVTLLEEARAGLVFSEAAKHGVTEMARGLIVVKLAIHYRTPLLYTGQAVEVEISARNLRVSSFTLDYVVHAGKAGASAVVATAETLMAPYSLEQSRPRRLTDAEKDFLADWCVP